MAKRSRTTSENDNEYATALARWESEGGRDPSGWRRSPGVREVAYVQGLPRLPPGYTSQVAWGFRDPAGGLYFDFFRVYRPPQPLNGLGPIAKIDDDLSYWQAIFQPSSQSPPVCRWMNYRQSRQVIGRALTFAAFSAPWPASGPVLRLLRAAVPLESPPVREGFRLIERPAE
jgi:hypothetical protein